MRCDNHFLRTTCPTITTYRNRIDPAVFRCPVLHCFSVHYQSAPDCCDAYSANEWVAQHSLMFPALTAPALQKQKIEGRRHEHHGGVLLSSIIVFYC